MKVNVDVYWRAEYSTLIEVDVPDCATPEEIAQAAREAAEDINPESPACYVSDSFVVTKVERS